MSVWVLNVSDWAPHYFFPVWHFFLNIPLFSSPRFSFAHAPAPEGTPYFLKRYTIYTIYYFSALFRLWTCSHFISDNFLKPGALRSLILVSYFCVDFVFLHLFCYHIKYDNAHYSRSKSPMRGRKHAHFYLLRIAIFDIDARSEHDPAMHKRLLTSIWS